uniref:Heparanase n=1 Tax=Sus scrofa TaxID=9823 RepID=A0A5G2QG63_PIG
MFANLDPSLLTWKRGCSWNGPSRSNCCSENSIRNNSRTAPTQILNPLSKARDRTCDLMDASQPQHMEVPRLGAELELWLLAYTTATETADPGCICDLYHSSWQYWILNPLSKARDQTCDFMDASQIRFCCATMGTPNRSSVDMLYTFANCSGLDLIFGLNALLRTRDLHWDSSNAQLLLDYCASKNYNISWELGNEPNSFRMKAGIYIDGFQLGEDFIDLHKLLRKSAFKNAKLYGPDISQPRRKNAEMLKSFLKTGGKVIDSVTWHHYYLNGQDATKEDFLNPDVMDTFISSAQKIFQVVEETRPHKKVWLGETSSAYGGGAPSLSNTFIAGFMWLDKLGLSAKLGIEVVMRQVLFGAGTYHLVDRNFEPLPDYWLSLLFKKLVGTKVLTASVRGPERSKLRVYLHCTNNNHPQYKEGALTLYALNLHNVTKRLQLPRHLGDKQVDKYLMQPSGPDGLLSKSVQLNGQTLKMVNDQTLPALTEKPLRPGSALGLPPFSYGFFVIRNAKVAACI